MIQPIRPPITCEQATKPLQTFDDCAPDNKNQFISFTARWAESCWPNIYTGLHEGLDARDASAECKYLTCIGHLLTTTVTTACAQLDFSIRRGYDVSHRNQKKETVLRQAMLCCAQEHTHTPVALIFFQVLADAHAPYEVSKNNTAELIRKYIASNPFMSPHAATFRNKIAELFDGQVEE